jgi:hypothetical protein
MLSFRSTNHRKLVVCDGMIERELCMLSVVVFDNVVIAGANETSNNDLPQVVIGNYVNYWEPGQKSDDN